MGESSSGEMQRANGDAFAPGRGEERPSKEHEKRETATGSICRAANARRAATTTTCGLRPEATRYG